MRTKTLIALLLICSTTFAANIYVDGTLGANITNGTYSIASRNNTGTDGNAYKTIAGAMGAMAAGDTVKIRAGTYYEQIAPETSGTAGSRITIEAYGSESVIVDTTSLVSNSWTDCVEDEPNLFGNSNWDHIKKVRMTTTPLCLFEAGRKLLPTATVEPSQTEPWWNELDLDSLIDASNWGQKAFIVDANRTEADDFWNGCTVLLWSHSVNNWLVYGTVTDFDQGDHKLNVSGLTGNLDNTGTWPDGYAILHQPSTINAPGEWAYYGNYVYIWPVSTADLTNSSIRCHTSHSYDTHGIVVYQRPRASYTTWKNLEIRGVNRGVTFLDWGGSGQYNSVSLIGLTIHDTCDEGIYVTDCDNIDVNDVDMDRVPGGFGVMIGANCDYARVHVCDVNGVLGTGIYLSGGTYPVVYKNTIGKTGVHGNGMSNYGATDALFLDNIVTTPRISITISSCGATTFLGNRCTGGVTGLSDWGSGSGEILLIDNTIIGTITGSAAHTWTLKNNILSPVQSFAAGTTHEYNAYTGTLVDGEGQAIALGTGEINSTSAALFTSESDWHLKSNSPALDSGTSIASELSTLATTFSDVTVTTDIDGDAFEADLGAYAEASYTLTITAANGSVTLSPAGGTYTAGTTVTLTPVSNSGYRFTKWTGDLSGYTTPTTITMNADHAVTANFEACTWYTITVTQPSNGSISPVGPVSMPSLAIATCDQKTFTITPAAGYTVADVQIAGVSQGGMTTFVAYGCGYNTTLSASMIATPDSDAETFYVDGSLAASITNGSYSIANRNNSGADGNCYKTIGEACYVAGPGDTVYIRAGTYDGTATGLPGNVLWPRVSGTAEAHIAFKNYNNEVATIGYGDNSTQSWPSDNLVSIARGAICMRNVSYIDVNGLNINTVGGWLWGRGCSYVTVENCSFANSKYGGKGIARFIDSSYCSFKNCTFWNSAYDCMVLLHDDHCIVEDCTFDKGVHTNLSMRSTSYCIIRNNHFRNAYYYNGAAEKLTEMYDQKVDTTDPLGPTYTPVPFYNQTQHNLVEGNWFGYHPEFGYAGGSRTSGIQFSGQKTIIRKNIFSNPILQIPDSNGGVAGGVGIVWRWGGSWDGWKSGHIAGQAHEAGFVWGNRIYNNVFYGYDGGKMTFPVDNAMGSTPNPPPMKDVENYTDYPYSETYRFDDNVVKNNLMAGGEIAAHINWTYIIAARNSPVQMFIRGRRAQTQWVNNCFYGNAGDPNNDLLIMDVQDYGQAVSGIKTPAYLNTNQATAFIGNIQGDPLISAIPLGTTAKWGDGDFHLQPDSPCINAGAFLTTITTASGSGTSFTVADPNYFFDGFGIAGETGDVIKIQSSGDTGTITDVNYATGAITVSGSVTWTQGTGIALNYTSTAPDIGYMEYSPVPDPIATFSPEPNATGQERITTATWGVSDGADGYRVYGGTAEGSLALLYTGTTRSLTLPTQPYSGTYYWRVDSYNVNGTRQSAVMHFTVMDEPSGPPQPPAGQPRYFFFWKRS